MTADGYDADAGTVTCGACGQTYDVDVEHDCDLDPGNEVPAPVAAIAEYWGGADTKITEQSNGIWIFTADGGISRYTVHAPWLAWPAYEDSGRPCGKARCAGFHVRPDHGAPDDHFEVPADGHYRHYNGQEVDLW